MNKSRLSDGYAVVIDDREIAWYASAIGAMILSSFAIGVYVGLMWSTL